MKKEMTLGQLLLGCLGTICVIIAGWVNINADVATLRQQNI